MFDYTVTSQKTVGQAIADLKQALSEAKFGVLWELDVPAQLQAKGVDFQIPFHILEVCNPKQARHALETNINVGYFLPCKLVVFRQQDETRLGMLRPTEIVGMLNDQSLADFAEQVEQVLTKALDEAK
jgi:uncharacterized protein (DUF302 family)